jgi:REP element-mobilizing transposase RayT
MHSIKSYSANRIQRLFGKKGQVWLNEYYDRVIRDEEDYLGKMSYIINNPVKARLVERPEDYRWLFVEGSDSK